MGTYVTEQADWAKFHGSSSFWLTANRAVTAKNK